MSKETIIIRTAQTEDAAVLLKIQKEVLAEGIYLTTAVEEFDKTVEQQRAWIESILQSDRETILVAETPDRIVGWLVFMSSNRVRLSHTGSIGMMIQGILDWGEANPFIEKISLGVFSTNERAIRLYKKMRFVEEGRKIREVKMENGAYIDDVLMYKLV